jgi:hypothetical protein
MAFLLLLSTVSFTVEKHFCGDVLIGVAVFSEVEKCTMEVLETEQDQLTRTPCCKDTLEIISGQNQLNISLFDHWSIDQLKVLVSFADAYKGLTLSLEDKRHSQTQYHPPNLVTDLQVLDQVFII